MWRIINAAMIHTENMGGDYQNKKISILREEEMTKDQTLRDTS